jgi:cyclase
MPLSKRIIPCLDVDHGKVVKGINFLNLVYAGNPSELAKKYCEAGADELVFLDITASPEKRRIIQKYVRNVASNIDIPFTVGGGIRSEEDARMILCNGADKVSVNSEAVKNPDLITNLKKIFGSQCVVVAIDAKRRYDKEGDLISESNKIPFWFEVFINGGQEPTGIDAITWAEKVAELGAGELLVTSMDKDGTNEGFDIELTLTISERTMIPIIASGGAGKLDHFYEVFTKGKADAALAASIFHYDKFPVNTVKKYLLENGVIVRP